MLEAVQQEWDGRATQVKRSCKRRSPTRFWCRASWRDAPTAYRGVVVVRRRGDKVDWRDHYLLIAVGRGTLLCDRCSHRTRARGLIIDDTRRARFGEGLTLMGEDGALIRITPEEVYELSTGEDRPAEGTRFIAVSFKAENRRNTRAEIEFYGDVIRVVLPNKSTVQDSQPYASGCETASLDVPARSVRRGCIAFAVPVGVSPTAVEISLGAHAPELGIWTIR